MGTPILSRRRFLHQVGAASALVVVGGSLSACSEPGEIDRLSFLNWQDYIDPALLDRFTSDSGIEVTYETYESNDELARRLAQADRVRLGGRKGASSFDLIVPSDNFVSRFRRADSLQTLDHDRLPNLEHLDPVFTQSMFDPGNRVSVPWATGTTAIGYDTTVFSDPPDYDVFLDEAYAGRTTILNEARDAFALALLEMGEDPNTRDQGTIDAAADLLIKMKAVIRGFDSGSYLDDLADGTLVAAHAFSSDVALARERNPDLAFVIPAAGGTRWIDCVCIPDAARSPKKAHQLINFFLDPEVAALNTPAIGAFTGNAASLDLLPDDIRDDTTYFPPAAVLEGLRFLDDLGDDEDSYQAAWERVTG